MSKFNKQTEFYPELVRVKRVRGNVEQSCDLYVSKECNAGGWALPQSKWYIKSISNEPEEYLEYLESHKELCENLYELVGQSLGCWCAGTKAKSCHVSVLVNETVKYLNEYFERYKKQNRNLTVRTKYKGPKMEIVPQPIYNLKINNSRNSHIETKKYNIKVTKVAKQIRKRSLISETVDNMVHKVVKRTESSNDIHVIEWDSTKKQWVLPDGYKLTDDYRIPVDAKVMFGRDYSAYFNLKKGDQLTKEGKISIAGLISKPIVMKTITKREQMIPDFENDYVLKFKKLPAITQSAIGDLYTGKSSKLNPFVCRVESRLFNKKTNRYMLKLYDGDAMYKVQLGSQLFEMIKHKFIDQGDLIQVIDYVSTKINSRKRTVILYNIKKIIVNTK